MKIHARIIAKTNTPRYEQLKAKLIEVINTKGEATSRTFAAAIGIISESQARRWLARFEKDGIIRLFKRYEAGRKAYRLVD